MRRPLCSLIAIASLAVTARAQNQPTVDQLQTELADARKQLAAAQDRKNELAAENERLQKHVTELDGRIRDIAGERDSLLASTYPLRAHYAAWQNFIELYPSMQTLWEAYFYSDYRQQTVTDLLGDGKWPFSLPDWNPGLSQP